GDVGGVGGGEGCGEVQRRRQRPGEKPELRERRSCLEGDRRGGARPFLEEEALASQVRDPVEEPIDPLEAEVGHPDLVAVREAQRHPVGAETVRLLGVPLQGGELTVLRRRLHGRTFDYNVLKNGGLFTKGSGFRRSASGVLSPFSSRSPRERAAHCWGSAVPSPTSPPTPSARSCSRSSI